MTVIACMNAARGAIERAALNVLERAERAVGVAGMMSPHPLERLIRDLRTYLRQLNPDGALAAKRGCFYAGRPERSPCFLNE
jgi:Tfp pilus assembly protein PilW